MQLMKMIKYRIIRNTTGGTAMQNIVIAIHEK
jgi:hypothetical protein